VLRRPKAARFAGLHPRDRLCFPFPTKGSTICRSNQSAQTSTYPEVGHDMAHGPQLKRFCRSLGRHIASPRHGARLDHQAIARISALGAGGAGGGGAGRGGGGGCRRHGEAPTICPVARHRFEDKHKFNRRSRSADWCRPRIDALDSAHSPICWRAIPRHCSRGGPKDR